MQREMESTMKTTILGLVLAVGLTVALNAPVVAQEAPVEFADLS